MSRPAVGIDVGGTFAKVAAVARTGRILRLEEIPTRPAEGPAAFVGRLGALLDSWPGPFAGAGLGLAGEVDAERGRLRFAPNMKGWDGFDFKRALTKRLRVPVAVDNDANLAVWGAYVTELKRGPRDVAGVTLGTGVGGGIVIGGRLYRGATGSAGEVGHTRVETPGEPCHCGLRGCLEAYAGSYGVLRTARKVLSERRFGGSLLFKLSPGLSRLELPAITEAARRGDAAAREIWARTGRYLAAGLANLIMILNPEVVLVLGGVSRAGRFLMDPVREHLSRQPFPTPFRRAKLVVAANHNGGCVGAALLALERQAPGQ